MHYTPQIRKSAYTFEDILNNAKKWFASLSESKRKSLKENLDHGAALLDSKSQLKAYLHFIHQAKRLHAFENDSGIPIAQFGVTTYLSRAIDRVIKSLMGKQIESRIGSIKPVKCAGKADISLLKKDAYWRPFLFIYYA